MLVINVPTTGVVVVVVVVVDVDVIFWFFAPYRYHAFYPPCHWSYDDESLVSLR